MHRMDRSQASKVIIFSIVSHYQNASLPNIMCSWSVLVDIAGIKKRCALGLCKMNVLPMS